MKMCLSDPGLILLCTDLKLCPAAKVAVELKISPYCSPGNGCLSDCGGNPRGEPRNLSLQAVWLGQAPRLGQSANTLPDQSALAMPPSKGHTAGLPLQGKPSTVAYASKPAPYRNTDGNYANPQRVMEIFLVKEGK